ncbi:tetratricopeptide repeat protein [Leptothoe kymatousa]|uniref:Tetratricopeptide repeat protein n=1 Tax=Leptothoe kymatousa TAU-MAC 1615 TaxID=2364775 RepID=A0ABS5Y7I6_9CYAN|nr:tetratricopeptide repeat protein [Leptothoe kymatousa]MBT9313757.1 tetratricopeptide repeat protein [Leptothoe kymatousa TAU-MAC 1615]
MSILSTIKTDQVNHSGQQMTLATKKRLHQNVHIAIKAKNYGQGLRLLNYLIAQEPSNADYYSHRGLIYYHCHQWSQALGDYSQALRLNPSGDEIYSSRAKCNAIMGYWHAAISDYDCAINLNPCNLMARLEQGILLRNLKLYDDAITCFDLALFFGSLKAHVYAERGRTYHLDGHWNCAIGDYERSLALLTQSPNSALAAKLEVWMHELLG